MSKVNSKIKANGSCPVDGTIFEQNTNGQKIYCSPECKKKADAETRRRTKFQARLKEYKRLGEILGYADDAEINLRALSAHNKSLQKQVNNNARLAFIFFLVAGVFLVLWLAK